MTESVACSCALSTFNTTETIATSLLCLTTASFQKEIATQFPFVPCRPGPTLLQDLVAGEIDLVCGLAAVRADREHKGLCHGDDTRLWLAPDLPTFGEIGLPLSFSGAGWQGFFAPKGTPNEIIDRLNGATVQALADPLVRSRPADSGFESFRSSSRRRQHSAHSESPDREMVAAHQEVRGQARMRSRER